MKKSFVMWLETMKRHVATIEKHETLTPETVKFVFEHALAHLVLGYRMATELRVASAETSKIIVNLTDTLANAQAKANREATERVAVAEAVIPWWKAKDRFDKFARYLAQVLGVSTAAPYETIYDKLVSVAVSREDTEEDDEKRLRSWKSFGFSVWKRVTAKSADAPHFAEAVARFVNSDLKNVDVRAAGEPYDAPNVGHNLSVLLGDVEKFLRDLGFVPLPIAPEPDLESLAIRHSPVFDTLAIRRQVKRDMKKPASKK